ncbi:MAG TPA: PSD1 and planctomycete cytochrome C domain-containing protein, partial [Fimbriimonadaceae bacterium]|nr:PSD1 and planctomycete cytochrome C domain-containing protein [Fimbriimonadaceae bacterium]
YQTGEPERSLLLQRLVGHGNQPVMPPAGPLPAAQIETIRRWIDGGAPLPGRYSFGADVLPILKAHCAQCHGDQSPSSGHNLFDQQVMRRLVEPGKPEASVLWRRLHGLDGLPQMPMGFVPLSKEKLASIRAWIEEGASFEPTAPRTHWAYIAPVRPTLPSVRKGAWVRNAIDRFVLARLEQEGLAPRAEAPRTTLIRRLSLDLIGLPPTPAEVENFLGDRRPDAYDRLVDRLLASPHYGEHMARKWLDLARYADTHGYEKDPMRTAWRYRDWVIDAFNRNLSFDRFTIDQLAGDLLPNASLDQLIATGFHRNTMHNLEGGVDQEEAHHYVVVDRASTTATVWLGSTLACARCHDHKFDPISQRDFYAMSAIFGNTEIRKTGDARVSEEKWGEPEIRAPLPEQAAQEQTLLRQITRLRERMTWNTPEVRAERARWQAHRGQPVHWQSIHPKIRSQGLTFELDATGAAYVAGDLPDSAEYLIELDVTSPVTGLVLEVLPDERLPNKGPGRVPGGNFILSEVEVNGESPADAAVSYAQTGYPASGLVDGDPGTGWAISPRQGQPHRAVFQLQGPLTGRLQLSLFFADPTWKKHLLGKFRISLTSDPFPLRELEPRFESQSLALAPVRRELRQAQWRLDKLRREMPTAMIVRERPTPGPLRYWLMERGEFLGKKELVEAATPSWLPAPSHRQPVNRRVLARWLVSRDNPLTARVQVNRMWEQIFGRGLVETSEDFGTQGSPPTHAELLDWLAVEFMDRGWDMKAMTRLIVSSATYRQCSDADKVLLDRDPRNELLARGPRFRLDAETIRDIALQASGLLSTKIGGPSVMPYQPEGIWNSPYSGERWMNAKGDDRYRRGLYTFLKRTAPYPAFMTFDAASREECVVRRPRTNTPLQALALMNDPVIWEASQALGEQMRRRGIEHGFRACTGRTPTLAEAKRIRDLKSSLMEKHGKSESDALALVANTLLNLDETITKS